MRRIPVVLLVLALLAACGSEQEASEGGSASGRSGVAPNAGFGGVIEVTFSTDDAASQDALAKECGLTNGSRAGLATAPLPPSVRWYAEPPDADADADADAAIACMRKKESVLRVSLPL